MDRLETHRKPKDLTPRQYLYSSMDRLETESELMIHNNHYAFIFQYG